MPPSMPAARPEALAANTSHGEAERSAGEPATSSGCERIARSSSVSPTNARRRGRAVGRGFAGEIKRYFRDKTWAVNVPRDLHDRTLAVDRAARELESALGHHPTVAELAEHLDLEDEDVLETLHATQARRADSLDAPYGDDDAATQGETIASHDDGFHRAEQRADLARLTAILTPRDRRILALRFQHDLTQQEIGELVGPSQMQISRVLRQAIAKLRAYVAAENSRSTAA
jgi:RNA polymerase sigma factor (sigma-70 family)